MKLLTLKMLSKTAWFIIGFCWFSGFESRAGARIVCREWNQFSLFRVNILAKNYLSRNLWEYLFFQNILLLIHLLLLTLKNCFLSTVENLPIHDAHDEHQRDDDSNWSFHDAHNEYEKFRLVTRRNFQFHKKLNLAYFEARLLLKCNLLLRWNFN